MLVHLQGIAHLLAENVMNCSTMDGGMVSPPVYPYCCSGAMYAFIDSLQFLAIALNTQVRTVSVWQVMV